MRKIGLLLSMSLFLPFSNGCSTVVKADVAAAGMPQNLFQGNSTVITKFMSKHEVSAHCQRKLRSSTSLPTWHHACVYRKPNGGIVMALPKPGSLAPKAYADLLRHEYQHVGQALKGETLDHHGWN